MPLQFNNVPVMLAGLAQKDSALTKSPGALEKAINVEFDKQGRLNKRRGYQFVDVGQTVNRFDDDAVMQHLALRAGELLVVTHSYVAALGSVDASLRGTDTLVYRGPNNRGQGRLLFGSTSRTSQR
jgi:hypothetical protein